MKRTLAFGLLLVAIVVVRADDDKSGSTTESKETSDEDSGDAGEGGPVSNGPPGFGGIPGFAGFSPYMAASAFGPAMMGPNGFTPNMHQMQGANWQEAAAQQYPAMLGFEGMAGMAGLQGMSGLEGMASMHGPGFEGMTPMQGMGAFGSSLDAGHAGDAGYGAGFGGGFGNGFGAGVDGGYGGPSDGPPRGSSERPNGAQSYKVDHQDRRRGGWQETHRTAASRHPTDMFHDSHGGHDGGESSEARPYSRQNNGGGQYQSEVYEWRGPPQRVGPQPLFDEEDGRGRGPGLREDYERRDYA